MENIRNLIKGVGEISNKYKEIDQISGNNFNIFKIINLTTNEVRIHSKFIAELLSPNGSHGQGDVFLKLFVNQFEIKLNTKTATVLAEKNIGLKTAEEGGSIDIFIDDHRGGSIIIENKINAKDQENQLLRYFNYRPNNLFYLTLFGNEPSKFSSQSLILNTDFKLISYQDDIKRWLVACKKEVVKLPLISEGITHYINLINMLTGQTGTTKMNDEITEYMVLSANNLKQTALLADNMNDAKVKIQWAFWEALKEKITAVGLELIKEETITREMVNDFYTKTRNRDVEYGFWIKLDTKENKIVYFIIELTDDIYFGFKIFEGEKGGLALNKENKTLRDQVLDLNPAYKSSQHWLGYRYPSKMLNFRTFNSQAIFDLADDKKLNETTDAIVQDFLKDINKLKEKLKQ